MEADDMTAWNFYMRTATPFVRDFGLMNGRIADMPYEGVAREIFVEKLSAVHNAIMERVVAAAKEDGDEEKPQIVLEGNENG
jgi:hypothetical protein